MTGGARLHMAGGAPALDGLKDVYRKKILPLEAAFRYDQFYSPFLSDTEIGAKPMVLLLGQYSTGKTTFIQHVIGREYCGSRVGPEPTTDRFVAVMGGQQDRVVPGNAAAVDTSKPFVGLSKFGSNFLSKFQVSENTCPMLDSLTIVDTPGVLSGDKQRVGRSYDFSEVCLWFAEHADLILFFFDAHKLDISDELSQVMLVLKPFDDKVRIILNKADQIGRQELMRVYGALMWSLGKVVHTPEVMRVFIGSFHVQEMVAKDRDPLFEAEEQDLLRELKTLPLHSATRKVNDIVKRARLARAHALLVNSLRSQMPAMFGKTSKQNKLLADLPAQFSQVQQEYRLPAGDFPSTAKFEASMKTMDLTAFPKLSQRMLTAVNEALQVDIPEFMQGICLEKSVFDHDAMSNPFALSKDTKGDDRVWLASSIDREAHDRVFDSLNASGGDRLSGRVCHEFFVQSALPVKELGRLWALCDWDRDGSLTRDEFSMMMYLVKLSCSGIAVPDVLPSGLLSVD